MSLGGRKRGQASELVCRACRATLKVHRTRANAKVAFSLTGHLLLGAWRPRKVAEFPCQVWKMKKERERENLSELAMHCFLGACVASPSLPKSRNDSALVSRLLRNALHHASAATKPIELTRPVVFGQSTGRATSALASSLIALDARTLTAQLNRLICLVTGRQFAASLRNAISPSITCELV